MLAKHKDILEELKDLQFDGGKPKDAMKLAVRLGIELRHAGDDLAEAQRELRAIQADIENATWMVKQNLGEQYIPQRRKTASHLAAILISLLSRRKAGFDLPLSAEEEMLMEDFDVLPRA